MRLSPFSCKLARVSSSSSFAPERTHLSDILKLFCTFSNLEASNSSFTVNLIQVVNWEYKVSALESSQKHLNTH